MFLFEYDDTKHFRDLLVALKVVADENPVMFKLGPEGLAARQFDMAQQTMFDFSLPSSAFNKWNIEQDREIVVDLDLLLKALKTGKDEPLSVNLDNDKLIIVLTGSVTKKKTVPLPWCEDTTLPDRPIWPIKSKAGILTNTLLEALKDAETIEKDGDPAWVKIEINTDSLKISAVGDNGSSFNTYENGADDLISLTAEEPCTSHYKTSMLMKLVKACKTLSKVTNISISTDSPATIEPELALGKLSYLLVPYFKESPTTSEAEEKSYEEEVTGVSDPSSEPEVEEPPPQDGPDIDMLRRTLNL